MEPTLLLVGILTSAGVVWLSIRLGWLRAWFARIAVACWITGVVMLACLPLCESLPGSFVFAALSGIACAVPATWAYHRTALYLDGYPDPAASAPTPRRQVNWTPAQRVKAGMGNKYANYQRVGA